MGWTDRVEALDLDLGAGQLKLEGPTRGLGVLSPIVAVFFFFFWLLNIQLGFYVCAGSRTLSRTTLRCSPRCTFFFFFFFLKSERCSVYTILNYGCT
jgi:hypothetical protein